LFPAGFGQKTPNPDARERSNPRFAYFFATKMRISAVSLAPKKPS
jgi:hypothetical protein